MKAIAKKAAGFTAHQINPRHRALNPPRPGGFVGRYNRTLARARGRMLSI